MNVKYEALLLHDKNITQDIINMAIEVLKKVNIKVSDVKEISIERFEYDEERKQYNGKDILYKLTEENEQVIIIIISDDIYLPGLNYVIGLFRENDGALISTYRLQTKEQIKKKILHESGHLLGLGHCNNHCIMKYAESPDDIARLPFEFCISCSKKIGLG